MPAERSASLPSTSSASASSSSLSSTTSVERVAAVGLKEGEGPQDGGGPKRGMSVAGHAAVAGAMAPPLPAAAAAAEVRPRYTPYNCFSVDALREVWLQELPFLSGRSEAVRAPRITKCSSLFYSLHEQFKTQFCASFSVMQVCIERYAA